MVEIQVDENGIMMLITGNMIKPIQKLGILILKKIAE
jgi:hypothetical protein